MWRSGREREGEIRVDHTCLLAWYERLKGHFFLFRLWPSLIAVWLSRVLCEEVWIYSLSSWVLEFVLTLWVKQHYRNLFREYLCGPNLVYHQSAFYTWVYSICSTPFKVRLLLLLYCYYFAKIATCDMFESTRAVGIKIGSHYDNLSLSFLSFHTILICFLRF